MTQQPFRESVRSLLRDRLLDAAATVFADEGWRRLTMAKVADKAGVSRQTVYNEFGGKQQLAEALIMRELESFLAVVRRRFEAESALVPAVRSAVEGALVEAERSPLLRTVLETDQNGDKELLPIIIQSQWLIDRAVEFLVELVATHHPDLALPAERVPLAMETIVRLVLSHITRPSRSPEATADDIAFVVAAVLAGAGSTQPAGAAHP